jgi:hypothetical protein
MCWYSPARRLSFPEARWRFAEANHTNHMHTLRNILAALVFTLAGAAAFAQSPVHFGVKGGVNYSKIRFTEGARRPDGQYYTGFHGGVFGRLDLGRLYLQPELVYTEKGSRVTVPAGVTTEPSTGTVRLKTLDFPVLLGVKLVDVELANLRVMGGPVFSNTLAQRSEVLQRIGDKQFAFNKQNVGYQVGLGVDVATFTFDARYEGSLRETSTQFGSRPGVFLLSLGFKFL